MRFRSWLLPIVVLFELVPLAIHTSAQELSGDLTTQGKKDEVRRLDDAAAIARLVFDRYRQSPAGTQVSAKLTLLGSGGSLSVDDRRKIERNRLQTFVCQNADFRNRFTTVHLRCAGRTGEIFLVKFDAAGKIISADTDRNRYASHYATNDYVLLYHLANDLRTRMARSEFSLLAELELGFDENVPTSRGERPFAVRNGQREGDFVVSRRDGTQWCRGRFEADLPTGSWQLFASNGKPAERWEFRDGTIEKTPKAPRPPFVYTGVLGANDFAVTLVQGSPPPSTGPPRTSIRVSAAGDCESEFGFWKTSFRLTDEMQRSLRDLIGVIGVSSLKESYSDSHTHDGGWLTLSLRTSGTTKTVRFTNWYPRPVRDLINFFAADVLPHYPIEFLGSVRITDRTAQDPRTFLDDEK